MRVRILPAAPNNKGVIMVDTTEADGYYGDDDFGSEEIDLSFLDED